MSWRKPHDYLYCPDCHRKAVIWKARAWGEDGYYCTHRDCDFNCFTLGAATVDQVNRERLRQENGGGKVA